MQGLEFEKAGELERALEFYSNAAELDPLSKQALQLKGLLLKKLGRFSDAEEALKQALKLGEEDRELELVLSQVMVANRR